MEIKHKQRIALSICFFISGISFSTWASRIPSIKEMYDLSEAQLGSLLLVMPFGNIIGLPISGWLVSKFDSRSPLFAGIVLISLALSGIGWSTNIYTLMVCMFFFAFAMRIMNISMNTQSISLQKSYLRKIIGSFHAAWSCGGIVGVALSTIMVKYAVDMPIHLSIVAVISLVCIGSSFSFLLQGDKTTGGSKLKLGKPDGYIFILGLMVFCASLCEGGMFDWSGVYFKEVVGEEIFTLGYLTFMVFMAISRFCSDLIIEKIGMPKTYIISSTMVVCGVLTVVLFPYFWPALIGFSIVGLGIAAVMPMTMGLAGESPKYSPGMAISIVTTYSVTGMLLGPPLVGYLAELLGLKVAFLLFLLAGLMILPISRRFFKRQSNLENN
ncbi:MFS transporter [Zunongwangia endophytica]|uniref:MFS transporter n=1 Tax=Zunongwangia endophytica TaxID=1808945 RepID=A0ABV8H7J6_9FLAO|nr:MFS transporter [Zunongwangia endophytica]MDN3593710.1 MFS transporter [Zunongwangia endophytica]